MKFPGARLSLIAALGLVAACTATPPAPDDPAPPGSSVAPVPATKTPDPTPPAAVEKPAPGKAESSLGNGIEAYENGDYKTSQKELQSALAQGLHQRSDQIRANKYLAFIACASQQREVCKTHFLRILAINPRFNLSKAEIGHPIWGGVFKEAKAEIGKGGKK